MVRVTPTQHHTRRSSYKFFADPRGLEDPIFIRRTAVNQPPTQHPQSKEVRWLRDRFAWANHVWSNFDSSQRFFWRNLAIEVTTSMGGGRVEIKLLSGQELFIAMMMKIRCYADYISLVPQRWEILATDLCNDIFEDTVITLYSKSLRRTLVHMTADEMGLFQWISIAPWAAPFRLTIDSKCLGKITNQYETLEDLFAATTGAITHPVKVYNTSIGAWTLPQDPIWCKRSCSYPFYNNYMINALKEDGEAPDFHWKRPWIQVLALPDCAFALRAASYIVPGVNQVWWHDQHILDAPEWSWPIMSNYYKIYGPTGEIIPW